MAYGDSEGIAGCGTKGQAGEKLPRECQQGFAKSVSSNPGDYKLKHQYCEQGANGIDYNPFPTKYIGHMSGWTNAA